MIERVGQALYGENWVSGLAGVLDVDKRTVQRWAAGTEPVPGGIWRELLALAQGRERELPILIHDLRKALENERSK